MVSAHTGGSLRRAPTAVVAPLGRTLGMEGYWAQGCILAVAFPADSAKMQLPKGDEGANGCSSVDACLLCSSWGVSGTTEGPHGPLWPLARAVILVGMDQSSRLAHAVHHHCLGAGPSCSPNTANLLASAWLFANLEFLPTTQTKAQSCTCRESRAPQSWAAMDCPQGQRWWTRRVRTASEQLDFSPETCPGCLLNTDLLESTLL